MEDLIPPVTVEEARLQLPSSAGGRMYESFECEQKIAGPLDRWSELCDMMQLRSAMVWKY
jgi:hypothetical protein